MINTTAHETFLATYNFIGEGKREMDHVVPFNNEWNNGTDYLNGACGADLGLPVGSRFCSISPMPNNRKIIGVVTPVGNAVFFERYSAGEHGVIVTNKPASLGSLWYDGSQTADTIDRIMGCARGFNDNIGRSLQTIIEVHAKIKAAQAVPFGGQEKGCTAKVIED